MSITSALKTISEGTVGEAVKAAGTTVVLTTLSSPSSPVADIFTPWPCRMVLCVSVINVSVAVSVRQHLAKATIGTLVRSEAARRGWTAGRRFGGRRQNGCSTGICSGLGFEWKNRPGGFF